MNGESLTRMSRAVVLEKFSTPLSLREFALSAPSPGGMVVACGYGGICGTDLHLQLGHLPVPTPLVLGHEGLGTVDELGEGVEAVAAGAVMKAVLVPGARPRRDRAGRGTRA